MQTYSLPDLKSINQKDEKRINPFAMWEEAEIFFSLDKSPDQFQNQPKVGKIVCFSEKRDCTQRKIVKRKERVK